MDDTDGKRLFINDGLTYYRYPILANEGFDSSLRISGASSWSIGPCLLAEDGSGPFCASYSFPDREYDGILMDA